MLKIFFVIILPNALGFFYRIPLAFIRPVKTYLRFVYLPIRERTVVGKVAGVVIIVCCFGWLNGHAAQDTVYNLAIPAVEVEEALKKLATQTSRQLFFSNESVNSQISNAVSGNYTVESALNILLKGTDLSGRLTKRGVILVTSIHAKNNTTTGGSGMKAKQSLLAAAMGVIVGGSGAASINVMADESRGPLALEEITVTAQKRSESIMDVPISISAVSSEELSDFFIQDALDIQSHMPNLSIGLEFGIPRISIRGVALSSSFIGIDPSVAMHIDGAVVSPAQAQLGAFFDLDRVEVLRGPQGSLYGRNATGGSVNLISKRPTEEFDGYGMQSFGNYNMSTTELAVGGPLVDNVLLGRVALKVSKRDGYGENDALGGDVDDLDQLSGRVSLQFNPSDSLSILLTADRQEQDDQAYILHYVEADGTNDPGTNPPIGVPGLTADDPRDYRSNYAPAYNDREINGFTALVSWEINDVWSLESISAYRDYEGTNVQDLDSSLSPGFVSAYTNEAETRSQEFQLHYEQDKLKGLVGLYYFEEEDINDTPVGVDPLGVNGPVSAPILVQGELDIEAWAAFANFTYSLNEKWSLSLGARYSDEERSKEDLFTVFGTPLSFADEGDWDDLTVNVGVEYHPNDNMFWYAKYSEGFKSGAGALGQISPFVDPEIVDSYEVGMKGQFYDNTLRLSLAAFYNDFTDMQLARTVPAPGGAFGSLFENAGESTIRGVEAEFTFLVSSEFMLDGFVGYLDTEIDEYTSINVLDPCSGLGASCDPSDPATYALQDFAGNELAQAPELTAGLGAEYTFVFDNNASLIFYAQVNYKSETFFTPFNSANVQEDGVTTYSGNIKYIHPNGKFTVNAWGKNLGDEEYYTSKTPVSTSHTIQGVLAPPRTYGVTLSYKF